MFMEGKNLPIDLKGSAIFHCGPIVKKECGEWRVISAGPTTSTRMDIFESEFIRNFGVRVVIGKGGMGERSSEAMKRYGAVYGALTGGTAVLAAKAIRRVETVKWLDLGLVEAMWILEVENFGPLTIAIDSYGNNLYKDVKIGAEKRRPQIYDKLGVH
jgi:fumarate hydratase subunit beta